MTADGDAAALDVAHRAGYGSPPESSRGCARTFGVRPDHDAALT